MRIDNCFIATVKAFHIEFGQDVCRAARIIEFGTWFRFKRQRGGKSSHIVLEEQHARHVRDVTIIFVKFEAAFHGHQISECNFGTIITTPFR
ncbi:hypothetical protein D9M72_654510 [compost metagenome]